MGYAELIQQRLQTFPPEKQAEVYDFVEFIATRSQAVKSPDTAQRVENAPNDWTDEEFSHLSMAQALLGLENDPVDYALTDIKERWQ
jgi:hypothetical protein